MSDLRALVSMVGLSADSPGETYGEALASALGLDVPLFHEVKGGPNHVQVESLCTNRLTGMPRASAARAAGITPRMLRRWLKKGEKDIEDGKLLTGEAVLWRSLGEAEALAVQFTMGHVVRHFPDDWRAAAWVLEKGIGLDATREADELEEDGTTPQEMADAIRQRMRERIPTYSEGVVDQRGVIDAEE